MSFVKKILFIFFLLVPISNSFGAMITHNQTVSVDPGTLITGVAFNSDGTKVFTGSANDPDNQFINEFTLSIPYDVSSKTYTGDSERCDMGGRMEATPYDLEFSSDGMRFFIVTRNAGNDTADGDKAYGFDLTSPYDVSTCSFASETTDLDSPTFTSGSQAGDFDHAGIRNRKHRLQGIEINNDGTKLFLIWFDADDADVGARLLEYTLSTPYDLTTLSLVTSAGISFATPAASSIYVNNPASMRFSPNGKRVFITSHDEGNAGVTQVSFTNSFDTSSFVIDGTVNVNNLTPGNNEPRGLDFGVNGMKLIIANDFNQYSADNLMEYDLVCPFNIIAGKCPPITENKDRTGMAIGCD